MNNLDIHIKKNKKSILEDKNKLYKAFYDTTREKLGDKGKEIYLLEKDTLPTLGQITKKLTENIINSFICF